MIKVLNLYAGIGGNRKLWENVEVTAVEINPEIAKIYQDFFPKDKVIVADAHDYLLKHYKEFDFIWSSPPCPSHSRARFWGSFGENRELIYPDMTLWQEIIFLKHYAKCKWIVENVTPYYECFITPFSLVGRHYFWSNFIIPNHNKTTEWFPRDSLPKLQKMYNVDLSNLNIDIDKRTILRNMVNPKLGKYIFDLAFKEPQLTLNDLKGEKAE